MPEEIDPFAVNEQPETESSPQEDAPEAIDDNLESSGSATDEILDSINSVPNPVQASQPEKESILSRVKPRGRKNRRTPPPVDGVAPYNSSNTEPEVDPKPIENPDSQSSAPIPEYNSTKEPEQSSIGLPQFEDIPESTPEPSYQEPTYPQEEYQQQQYPVEQQNTGYANPLLTNQPLPVNYTAPNIYDPYNPYAAMVDINQGAPGQSRPTDWRFIITLGAAIVCLAGLIFFWIMWVTTSSSLTDASIQMEDLKTQSETGQKAANQLTDLQTTIRELNTTIEDLQEENDELKKNEDKLEDLEKENTTLEDKVKTLQNENATLSNDVEYWRGKAQ